MHLNELLKYENENDELNSCENSHRQFQLFLKIKTWFR